MFKKVMLLLLISCSLLGEREPVMLKIMAKGGVLNSEHRAVFRMGVEEVLTSSYRLIDEAAQEEALREQSTQQKKSCYDDSCLVDVGKMIAARGIFLVEVIKVGTQYAFKMRYIDIEQATTERTKSMFYKDGLNNGEQLLKFSKKLTSALLGGRTTGQSTIKYTRKYRVTLRSKPSGARIYDHNNRYIGVTPFEVTQEGGSYQYRFSKDRYREQTKTVTFDRNKSVQVTLISSDIFKITFKANTPADVFINGQLKGKTPLTLEMKKGYYNLTLKSLVKTIQKRLNIDRNGYYNYELYDETTAEITSNPSGASVKINGVYKGVTPLNIKVDIRYNKIEVSKSGYYTRTRKYTPSKYQANKYHFSLSKRYSYRSMREDDGFTMGFSLMQFQWGDTNSGSAGAFDIPMFSLGYSFLEGNYKEQSRFYIVAQFPLLRMGFVDDGETDEYGYDSGPDVELTTVVEPSLKIMYGWSFNTVLNFDIGLKWFYSNILSSDFGVVARMSIGFAQKDEMWMDALGIEVFYGLEGHLIINAVLVDFFILTENF